MNVDPIEAALACRWKQLGRFTQSRGQRATAARVHPVQCVGEARYIFHPETGTVEFGISIDDRWQGHGIGAALIRNLECRAAAFGAQAVFGDTLRSNEGMMAVARKAGYAFTNHPDDWKLVRFEKAIGVAPSDIPCASWRIAAASREAAALAN